jgi:hypothetical protein
MHARRVTGESCAPFLDSDVAISHRFLNHAATWNIIYNIYYIYIYIVGRGAFEWPNGCELTWFDCRQHIKGKKSNFRLFVCCYLYLTNNFRLNDCVCTGNGYV